MGFRPYFTGQFNVEQNRSSSSFCDDVPAKGAGWRYSLKRGRRTNWFSLPVHHGETLTAREIQIIALIVLAQLLVAGLIFAIGQSFVPFRLALKISLICLIIGAISMVVGFFVYNHSEHRIHYSGWSAKKKSKVLQFLVSPVSKRGMRSTKSEKDLAYGRSVYVLRISDEEHDSHINKLKQLEKLSDVASSGC